MAYQSETTIGNGVQTDFSVPFPYLDKSHVKVQLDGVSAAFTWVNDGLVRVTPAPASGVRVKRLRETPTAPLATFEDNKPYRASIFNLLALQAFYRAEETGTAADKEKAETAAALAEEARIEAQAAAVAAGEALEMLDTQVVDAVAAREVAVAAKNEAVSARDTALGYRDTVVTAVSGFEANVTAKTAAFNSNASTKTSDFDSNASSKQTAFDTNATNKTAAFDSNAAAKTANFNNNAATKTSDFDANAEGKTTEFNTNASTKTGEYNDNAASKITALEAEFNSRVASFNSNATAKTTAFDNNAVQKTNDFNALLAGANIVPISSSRTNLAARTGMVGGEIVYLSESNREGLFRFATGNQSANITADTQQGVFVPPASAPTGASGAWRRIDTTDMKPEWFGAWADGATNCAPAINGCLNMLGGARLSRGVYRVTAPVVMAADGMKLTGTGVGSSILRAATNNQPAVNIGAGTSYIEVTDMTIDRTGTPVAGGEGIFCAGITERCRLERLLVEKHWCGLYLRGTANSDIQNVYSRFNKAYGVYMKQSPGLNAIQWYIDNILVASNDLDGLHAESTTGAGTPACAVGTWRNVLTFANTGPGIAAIGFSAMPIHGVRIDGGFTGENGSHGLYLGTYGGQHTIRNMFSEIAGTRTTGSSMTTPASNTGDGIYIDANNGDVTIVGCNCNGNKLRGIYFASTTGNISIVGGQFTNNTNQGIVVQNGANATVVGTYHKGNLAPSITSVANAVGVAGNLLK